VRQEVETGRQHLARLKQVDVLPRALNSFVGADQREALRRWMACFDTRIDFDD
jgi:hypothetical protein